MPGQQGNILIVEDNPDLAYGLRTGLEIEGYEVAEIAVKTERSKRTVERVLQEFRQKMRAILSEEA